MDVCVDLVLAAVVDLAVASVARRQAAPAGAVAVRDYVDNWGRDKNGNPYVTSSSLCLEGTTTLLSHSS